MPDLPYTSSLLEYLLPIIKKHTLAQDAQPNRRPFILGLTGLQGCGKSTLAADIVQRLNHEHDIRSIEISLDDFYLTHKQRQNLHELGADPNNALLKVRGQPGTHDTLLAKMTLGQFSTDVDERSTARKFLKTCDGEVILPVFDKSLFMGEGDRVPREDWRTFAHDPPIQVVVFEGWCVGFRSEGALNVAKRWKKAKETRHIIDGGVDPTFSITVLADHRLEDLQFVDRKLQEYCERFMGPQHLDALIHLDTHDLVNVYKWRLEQEHAMRKVKETGMTDDQVVDFVKGYMPAYEMYLDGLREGFFSEESALGGHKLQLHVVMDKQRNVVEIKSF